MLDSSDNLSRTDRAILNMSEWDIRRFWKRVEFPRGRGSKSKCWGWSGSKTPKGYGRFRLRNGGDPVIVLAHRVSYFLLTGTLPPPEAPCVLHRCDNPPCTRFDHIHTGTLAENTLDMHAKGRGRAGGKAGSRPVNPDAITEKIKAALLLDPLARSTDLAAAFGCSISLVGRVRHGRVQKPFRKRVGPPPQTKADRILEVSAADPSLGPMAIARIIGCNKSYVIQVRAKRTR